MKFITKLFLIILSFLILQSISQAQNASFITKEIKYIISRVSSVNKSIMTLQDGTIWEVNRFLLMASPNSDVIVVFNELGYSGIAYIDGTEMNAAFLGTTYNDNEVIKYNWGSINYITEIDSSGILITFEDSTVWMVHPEQRESVTTWEPVEKIVLDRSEQFIINLRMSELITVAKIDKEEYLKRQIK